MEKLQTVCNSIYTFNILKNLTFACTWTSARSHKFDETAEKS